MLFDDLLGGYTRINDYDAVLIASTSLMDKF